MNRLNRQAFVGLAFLAFVLGMALFIPALSFNYWQAWIYLVVFFILTGAITLYLMKNDPALLQRRMNSGPTAEKETIQKIIQSIAGLAFLAIFILSALDHRFGWSNVPVYAIVIGDILVAQGLYFVFLVFKENTFTSAIIEVAKEQKVISTGPYALVRHPMYSGAFIMLIGTPVALGSWVGLLAVIPVVLVIIWRLLNEEKFLKKNLIGYGEYAAKVRFRLIPFMF